MPPISASEWAGPCGVTYERCQCSTWSISVSKAMMLPVRPKIRMNTAAVSPAYKCRLKRTLRTRLFCHAGPGNSQLHQAICGGQEADLQARVGPLHRGGEGFHRLFRD